MATTTPIFAGTQSTFRIAAGFILLAMAIASPIGFLVALPQGQYGITTFVGFIITILDIVVALSLNSVLHSGGKILANWAALLRILYSIGLLTATIVLIIGRHGNTFVKI